MAEDKELLLAIQESLREERERQQIKKIREREQEILSLNELLKQKEDEINQIKQEKEKLEKDNETLQNERESLKKLLEEQGHKTISFDQKNRQQTKVISFEKTNNEPLNERDSTEMKYKVESYSLCLIVAICQNMYQC